MKLMKTSKIVLAGAMALMPMLMHAQATRTWVSGVGDDANPCSRTAPCKTWAGAISKTATGGEIDALDPGGFGGVTITKSITLDGGGGQVASTLVAGTNGIVVNAPGANVTLRNLRLQGIQETGIGGLNGILLNAAGTLQIDHCAIMNFAQNGIAIEPGGNATVEINDTMSVNNLGAGLYVSNSTGTAHVTVTNSHFVNNQNGVLASDNSVVTVSGSDANGNSNAGYNAQGVSSAALLNVVNSSGNANVSYGVVAGGGGALSVVNLSGATLYDNPTKTKALALGTIRGVSTGQ